MFSRRSALWALGVIFLANFFNYVDRQLVSALEKPLRGELDLDAVQFGFLWTLFTIGYLICAVPVGLLADRFSRTRLFALCIVVWSIATIASGLAKVKLVLYIARIFIGVGEAGCLVIGPSLISDLFEPSVRGRALSVFYLGLPLGGTAAFILAGVLLEAGWRNLFFLAGVPGFIIALLVWLMADPPRGSSEGSGHGHGMHGGGTVRDYLRLLQTPTLALVILAQAFAVITLMPLIHFGTKFFVQARGLGEGEARVTMGLMALVAGALGNSLSGILGDRLAKRTKGAYALLATVGFLAGWPCLYIGFSSTERMIFLPALTLGCFFYFLCMPAVNTQIANVVSPAQRAAGWALAVFILHLLGDMAALPAFGAVEKALTPSYGGNESLAREHTFGLFSFALLPASLCCFLATLTARRDTERVARMVEEQAGKN
jgi:MFS transporter, Spinster family, sphingosine-1-phosphate transporter